MFRRYFANSIGWLYHLSLWQIVRQLCSIWSVSYTHLDVYKRQTLEAGGKHDTDDARSSFVTELVFCGDNMVYMIDAGLANETTYKDAVTWSWDATEAAAVLGLDKSRCNHPVSYTHLFLALGRRSPL